MVFPGLPVAVIAGMAALAAVLIIIAVLAAVLAWKLRWGRGPLAALCSTGSVASSNVTLVVATKKGKIERCQVLAKI